MQYNPQINKITVFAPATCGNVIVGFDLLGLALESLGDQVTLERNHMLGLRIKSIDSKDPLPFAVDQNIATYVILQFCQDNNLPINFDVSIRKGIPMGSGLGGSAASAVAAIVALNGFLPEPVNIEILAEYAIKGEALVSGSPHADNVVPCLYGGITLTPSIAPLQVLKLPLINLYCVVIQPQLQIKTKDARAILPKTFSLTTYTQQSAHLASFIVALYENRLDLIAEHLKDVLIEPCRAKLVKGFQEVKRKAIQAGALGVSLSGSGPTVLAMAKDAKAANTIKNVMIDAFTSAEVASSGWISKINGKGAFIQEQESC